MSVDPIAPIWLVLPLALIAIVVQAGYLMAIKELPNRVMPASRKRIRTASSWLSMFLIPLSAYGFGIATMDDPGVFTIVWMMVIGLVVGILMLATLDAINTMRLHRHAKSGLKSDFRQSLRLTKPLFEDENENEHE